MIDDDDGDGDDGGDDVDDDDDPLVACMFQPRPLKYRLSFSVGVAKLPSGFL